MTCVVLKYGCLDGTPDIPNARLMCEKLVRCLMMGGWQRAQHRPGRSGSPHVAGRPGAMPHR
ncbi:hypothetical protein C0J52_21313 [Blattella germanica]|nr:hypothetical protein C0J52_21313 [Blattella germanica]